MEKLKRLGIWMDHSNANTMEFTDEPFVTKTIQSDFTHQVKEETLNKSENVMHNKEQHRQSEYYKKLSEVIKNYDEVLLFGPTDAKVELFNLLNGDSRFSKIKIRVANADKMTEHQQHAFVKTHFESRQFPPVSK